MYTYIPASVPIDVITALTIRSYGNVTLWKLHPSGNVLQRTLYVCALTDPRESFFIFEFKIFCIPFF